MKADLRREQDILDAFAWIEKNTSGIDILINNAGAGKFDSLLGKVWIVHIVNIVIP